MISRSRWLMTRLLRSGPAITRSTASSNSGIVTFFLPGRAAGAGAPVPGGGGGDDDVGACVEAVHLHEDLVQRLFALVVAAAEAGAAVAADGVDLVDEDGAGGGALRPVGQGAHAGG